MIETHLNLFDAIVIGLMVLSCVFAFFRGFVREILSLGAWIGAGIVTVYYFPSVAVRLQPYFRTPTVAAGVATLAVYVAALIIFSLFNMLILKFLKEGSDVGLLDNMLGLLFGAFRGALIISLGYFLLTIALPEKEYPAWLKTSVTRPYVEQGAVVLARVAPHYLREISSLERRAVDEARDNGLRQNAPDNAVEDTAAHEDAGYSHNSEQQLNRLLDATAPSR
ncbi:MAG: CvpA family protein [Pseudomonadota bacterium]|nr:CvpA family protein [Pseudomonadota bacterium]